MLTGFRYRLALTEQQAGRCAEFGDVCRAVRNTAPDQHGQARARPKRGFVLPCRG